MDPMGSVLLKTVTCLKKKEDGWIELMMFGQVSHVDRGGFPICRINVAAVAFPRSHLTIYFNGFYVAIV